MFDPTDVNVGGCYIFNVSSQKIAGNYGRLTAYINSLGGYINTIHFGKSEETRLKAMDISISVPPIYYVLPLYI